MLEATPDVILRMPGDSIVPLLTSITMALGFVGLLVQSWLLAVSATVALGVAVAAWLWPVQPVVYSQRGARHG